MTEKTLNDLIKVEIDPEIFDISPGLSDFLSILKETMTLSLALAIYKNLVYQNSWRKRGESGVWGNFGRKSDRIEVACFDHFEKGLDWPQGEEALVETLADASNYSQFWLGLIKEIRPEEYQVWAEKIRKEFDFKVSPRLKLNRKPIA